VRRIRVPNMMCLTSYALALVLVACVKVRKAKWNRQAARG